MEEWAAEGWTEEKLIEYWEWNNRSWQPHKFVQHLRLTPDILEQWWPLKDMHEFCLKLCAIYATVDISFQRELAEYLWSKWYRQGRPCQFGNAFARFIGSYYERSPKTIEELLVAHRCICAQVLLRQVILNGDDEKAAPESVDDRAEDPYENHENYHLEPIFHALFIVIDTLPPRNAFRDREPGDRDFVADTPVLLVRTGEHHDLKTGPIDFAPVEAVSEELAGNKDVRRINLRAAVDFVLELERQNNEL
ncbi:MAG: hypothetical protein Q9220_001767 [cf. Caloplaca sp. 1 TL-2023]